MVDFYRIALMANNARIWNRTIEGTGIDFRARSVHGLFHIRRDELDFDDERTTRGNLLVLGDGRRLGEILLDARRAAGVVGRQVGSAGPGMGVRTRAALRTPRLPTLDVVAESTLAERHPRLM